MFTDVFYLINRFATAWSVSLETAACALQLIADYFTIANDDYTKKQIETVEYHAYNAYATYIADAMSLYLRTECSGVIMVKNDFGRYILIDRNGHEPEHLHLLTDGTVFVLVETAC